MEGKIEQEDLMDQVELLRFMQSLWQDVDLIINQVNEEDHLLEKKT